MMDEIIPWSEWIELIRPFYPKGDRDRPPRGIEVMLRMYLVQSWFNLSDAMVEDAIYDSYAIRSFMGLNFHDEQAPDATTLLKFRRLLEEQELGKKMFEAIGQLLESKGCMMRGGTIVDATIIQAPSSTKNASGERDEEMHQTKKGNQLNRRPGTLNRKYQGYALEMERVEERRKSSVRSKVEHPFRIVKVLFGYRKTVYRGLSKNLNRLYTLFGSANLLMWC